QGPLRGDVGGRARRRNLSRRARRRDRDRSVPGAVEVGTGTGVDEGADPHARGHLRARQPSGPRHGAAGVHSAPGGADVRRPRVVLADDHRMVADGLKSVLSAEFDVIDVVEDGAALVASAHELTPDVIVADISMPRLSGIEALEQIRKENPGIKVVFLTMHTEVAYARRALAAGAAGFVIKHSAAAELVMAVHAALKGEIFVTPALAGELLHRTSTQAPDRRARSLTPRQREILEL